MEYDLIVVVVNMKKGEMPSPKPESLILQGNILIVLGEQGQSRSLKTAVTRGIVSNRVMVEDFILTVR